MVTALNSVRSFFLRNALELTACISFFFIGSYVAAENLDVSSTHTLGYSRASQLIDDEDMQRADLVFAPYLQSQWRAIHAIDRNSRLTYVTGLEVTGLDETRFNLNGSVTYQRNFGESNKWQWRVSGETVLSLSENMRRFQRERLTFRLQKRYSPEHTTSGRVRLGYRNQNEALFDGFDQSEALVELTHVWRPNRNRLAVSGTIYAEARRAEFERFSYDEVGLRGMFRVPISDVTEITARASYYQRDFRDDFSAADPTIRSDERVRLSLEWDHEFSEMISGKVWVGLDDNASTIAERDFGGSTIGISATYTF